MCLCWSCHILLLFEQVFSICRAGQRINCSLRISIENPFIKNHKWILSLWGKLVNVWDMTGERKKGKKQRQVIKRIKSSSCDILERKMLDIPWKSLKTNLQHNLKVVLILQAQRLIGSDTIEGCHLQCVSFPWCLSGGAPILCWAGLALGAAEGALSPTGDWAWCPCSCWAGSSAPHGCTHKCRAGIWAWDFQGRICPLICFPHVLIM